jgi:hypothetical protein
MPQSRLESGFVGWKWLNKLYIAENFGKGSMASCLHPERHLNQRMPTRLLMPPMIRTYATSFHHPRIRR